MLTDLLVAGLMIAVAPDLAPPSLVKPAAPEQRSDTAAGPGPCQGDQHKEARIALLAAHASFAAMHPFSLARLGAGAPGSTPVVSKAKDAAGCES